MKNLFLFCLFIQYVMLFWSWINSGFNAVSCIIMIRNVLSFMAHNFLKIGQSMTL